MTEYNILRPWETLDDWQLEYIRAEGNCFLLCGRQVGKSTAAALKAVELAVHKHKKGEDILIVANTERQAYNLFSKALNYALVKYNSLIKKGREKPTKHEFTINNVKIMCHPAGLMGEGLRGFTLKKIIIDEPRLMSREFFVAISPMVSVVGGSIDMLGTPGGKQGFFWDCSQREDFKKFYVSAENCPRHKKDFLDGEKKALSALEYAQEYLAVFLDELKRVFTEDLIRKCCVLKRPSHISHGHKHYMGVDIARLGNDKSSFEIIERVNKNLFRQVENIVTSKQLTTETEKKIMELNEIWPFEKESIGLDAGAGTLGVSILDHMLDEPEIKRKVVAINNRERLLDKDGNSKKKILKEDLYNNLVRLMEKGEIQLLDDDEIKTQLASVQFEYVTKANAQTLLRIFAHPSADIVEGIVRSAWLASKDKTLNIWCR